jgi:hypothetical protein
MGVDWNQVIPALIGSGVLAQGLGALMWAARIELRVRALEQKGQQNG